MKETLNKIVAEVLLGSNDTSVSIFRWLFIGISRADFRIHSRCNKYRGAVPFVCRPAFRELFESCASSSLVCRKRCEAFAVN